MTTRARQWLIVLGAVVALSAVYAAIGFAGVPRLVRSQLLSFVSQHYGRTASIGEIHFNPFTFDLELHDFTLPDADGAPMLAFRRLRLDLGVATFWRIAPSFSDIEIEQPVIRARARKDGALNLADLGKPFETPPQTAAPTPKSPPARLFVDRLSVSAGNLTYQDDSRPSPFKAQLEPITFELRDFSTTGRTDNRYALIGTSTRGEKFAWSGSLSVAPLASEGHFQVTDLQARTIWSYLRDSLGFELSNGRVNIDGEYRFAASSSSALSVDVHNVSVADLGIKPSGQDAEYIQHADVQVENTRLDLSAQRVDVGKIHLTSGTVRAWRDGQGAINLLQLMPASKAPASDAVTDAPSVEEAATADARATPHSTPAAAAAAGPTPAATAKPSHWIFAAPDISIENLRLELQDQLVKPNAAFTLAPVNVNVRGYSSAPGSKLEVDANLRINDSGQLQARARVSPESGAVSAHVDLNAFDLAGIQPYVSAYTQITLLSGALKSGLDIERSAGGDLDIKGDTEVTQLRTVDNALREDFVKWEQLKLEGLRYKSAAQTLSIASVSARAPYARLIIRPDQSLNLTEATKPSPGTAPPAIQTVKSASGERRAPGGNPGAMRIDIGTVRIADGSANFSDFWIQPNYAVSLQGLNGTIAGLSSNPKSRARVALEGKVDRYAPAHIAGEVNLLSAALFTDLNVSFKGVEMASVTPYSGRFAGYKIDTGKLSIDVTYHVENRKLDAKQRFVAEQLQLGEQVESPDAVHLPLRLAVALLKDRNGVINLDLPITGSLDDPQFRLGPIIWKAFVGLLTKVATSPFALLGNLFGGGENMNVIEFQPGATTLDLAAKERLASLAKALKERPQLQLDIPALYSPEVDGSALATQKPNTPAQGREPPARVDDAAATPQPASEHDLQELAQARARAIQDALLASGGIDATRVSVLAAQATAPAEGKVRVALSLK